MRDNLRTVAELGVVSERGRGDHAAELRSLLDPRGSHCRGGESFSRLSFDTMFAIKPTEYTSLARGDMALAKRR